MNASEPYMRAAHSVDPRFSSVDCVFFVIGAQKAGTTWLSNYLKTHPNVSVPEWKEHDYWNQVEGRPHPSRMLRVQKERRENPNPIRDIAALLPFTLHAKRQRAITLALRATEMPFPPYSAYADVILENADETTNAAGEICPEYALLKAETFSKMSALSPNVRFIYLMRDPVSRFLSGVRHDVRKKLGKNAVTPENLSKAINRHAGRENSRPLELSRYDLTLSQLDAGVPADNILCIFFEEMFSQACVREICDFLSIPFVKGNIKRRANSAGNKEAPVKAEDLGVAARALRPAYDFVRGRVGGKLPEKWEESAALC